MRRDEEVLPARLGDPGGQEPGLPHVPLASDWHVERKVKSLSRVQLFATPWTVSYQAPLSMEFSRREYWSGLPFASPGDLPDSGIELMSPALPADSSPLSNLGSLHDT